MVKIHQWILKALTELTFFVLLNIVLLLCTRYERSETYCSHLSICPSFLPSAKGQTIIDIILHRKLKSKQHEPHKNSGGEWRCSIRVSRSWSTCGTRHVTLVTVINNERIGLWLRQTEHICGDFDTDFPYRLTRWRP